MTIRVLHWEAFSTQPGQGNPAGVVLDAASLSDRQMQEIARLMGFNETAFLLPSQVADLRLRYFTPGHEVDLCGHATVASLLARHAATREALPRQLTFETLAGVLPMALSHGEDGNPLVHMQQARAQFADFAGDRAALAGALGIDPEDIATQWPTLYGSTGLWTLVVPIRTLAAIQRMRPSSDRFPDILQEMPRVSVHPFCLETLDPTAHLHARHFSSPYSGTVEDPVTGTASGVLGAYYDKFIESSRQGPLVVEQGTEVGRNGRVQVWATPVDDSYEVSIAGTGCPVAEVNLEIDE